MNDFLEILLGATVCFLPPALLIGGIFALLRYLRNDRDRERIHDLEAAVADLRGQNVTLLQRLSRLEAAVGEAPAGVERADGSAPAERRPDASLAMSAGAVREGAVGPAFSAGDPGVAGEVGASGEAPAVVPAAARPAGATSAGASEVGPGAGSESGAGAVSGAEAVSESASASGAGSGSGAASAPASESGSWSGSESESESGSAAGAGASEPAPAGASDPSRSSTSSAPSRAGGGDAPGIGWEQWIGVRGAAALGASILVLAGIYFFEYSIEHGWITPAMRVAAGTVVGLGCLLASELRLRRTHAVLANWLGGAGVGILYVAFWAGHALYELYPTWAAFGLLVAVTAACVTLAIRRRAAAIAALGLLGGFATPLALSTGSDRPIALFSYLLLLDGAMLWVAYRRRWAWMAGVCLLATTAYQGAWLLGRLDEPRLLLAFGIIAVFAVLFAALPRREVPGDEDRREAPLWQLTRSAGVLLPILLTVPLAARTDLGDSFWTTAAQLLLCTAAAGWVGLRHESAVLPTGAALAATGAILAWAITHPPELAGEVWQLVGLGLALAAVHHVVAEIGRGRGDVRTAVAPALTLALALLAIAALAAPWVAAAGPWPWLLLFGALGVSVARLASGDEALPKLQTAAAALAGLGLGVTFAAQVGREGQPGGALFLGVLVGGAVLAQVLGLLPRAAAVRRHGDHAAALFAAVLLPLVAFARASAVPGWALYGGTLLLAALVLLAAARRASSAWMVVALLATALAHGLWVARRAGGPFSALELAALGVATLFFAVAPLVSPRALRERPWAWRTAALAGPLYLLALRHVWLDVLGPAAIGVLPLLLAGLSIGAATAVRLRGPEQATARKVALVWLTASAAGFVTLAIPLQLDKEWITIGWALEAVALTVLWRRMDHPGLKYLAFALAGAVCVRLLANPYVLGYYPRADLRVLNWLTYTYLVPAGALVGMWALLRDREAARRRPWEKKVFGSTHAVLASVAATAAIGVVFVWLNLTIFDWYASGPDLTIPLDRMPARDLTLSIAWAVYALGLLALGMLRRSTALRVVSLALVLITSGKVFLYDLAYLADLYRVASLAGLAVSLIVISLAYQRFVFRNPRTEVRS